jgi:hypothetical protein
MRKEYDLDSGKPNPYAKRIGAAGRSALLERFLRAEGYVRLDDDVVGAFSSDAARFCIRAARSSKGCCR